MMNMDHQSDLTKRMAPDAFEEFEKCCGSDLDVTGMRKETEQLKKFTRREMEKKQLNLDIAWLGNESLEDNDNLPAPEELLVEIEPLLQSAVDYAGELQGILNNSSIGEEE